MLLGLITPSQPLGHLQDGLLKPEVGLHTPRSWSTILDFAIPLGWCFNAWDTTHTLRSWNATPSSQDTFRTEI
jgi:hypothetical protein